MHVDVNNENEGMQAGEMPENTENKPKSRYQINWKKLGTLIGGVVLIIALLAGIWWLIWGRDKQDDPVAVYDVAVMLKDQTNSDPEEDARTSLKAGDVVLARETGREWSDTEKISYLILKMKLKQSQAMKLVEPEYVELSEKEAIEEGLIDKERMGEMEKVELEEFLKKDVRARMYRIKIEDLEFDPMQVRNAQPFPDQEFDWKIVEKKSKYKPPSE
jgi:hypothetical protein